MLSRRRPMVHMWQTQQPEPLPTGATLHPHPHPPHAPPRYSVPPTHLIVSCSPWAMSRAAVNATTALLWGKLTSRLGSQLWLSMEASR